MRDELRTEFEWEMSGVPDKDILLAPIDLTSLAAPELTRRVSEVIAKRA